MTMLPREEHERRLALYRDGLNDREIAEKLYLTASAITYWRHINGLSPNDHRRKITAAMEQELFRLYQNGGSDGQIAKAVNLSKGTILSWRQRRGLAANFKQGERARGAERDV